MGQSYGGGALGFAGGRITAPRVAISMSPSNPAVGGDPSILTIITGNISGPISYSAGRITIGGYSFAIAQSGDLIDVDFDATLVETVGAAAVTLGTFNGVFSFLRFITSDPPPGLGYTLTLSAPLGGVRIGIASATFVTTDEPGVPVPGAVPGGINLSGGDFGSTSFVVGGVPTAGVLDGSYTYPLVYEIDHFWARGFREFRVNVRWSRLQPELNGALSEPDMLRLDALIARVDTLGGKFVLDCHEFEGRRPTPADANVKLGTSPVTGSAFSDFWERIVTRWAAYGDTLQIGFFNEPQGPSFTASEWTGIMLPILVEMRAAGITNQIHLPGAFWTGAHSWISSGNAAAFEAMLPNLPAGGPYAVEVHQYLDSDSSGTQELEDATVGSGSTRLAAFTTWARANLVPLGIKAHLGEFGISDKPQYDIEGRALLDFMEANADVWDAWIYWSAGPWWDEYFYSVEPDGGSTNLIDKPQMALLLDYTLPIATQAAPTDIGLSNNVSTPLMTQGTKIGELSAVDANAEDFHTFQLVNNAGGRYQIIGKEYQRGPTPHTAGQTYIPLIDCLDRGGNSLVGGPKPFPSPCLPSPDVNLTRVGASTINEGQSLTLRVVLTAPVPGAGFDVWCSGNVPAQFTGDWESRVRPAFEAAGCTVNKVNGTRCRIRFGNSTMAGNIDWTWAARADNLTEGGQFQANFFLDTPVGCTIRGSFPNDDSEAFFVNDTSLTPGLVIGGGPGSAYPGETITPQITMTNPTVGAKWVITASGQANDADFTTTLDAAITAALPAGLTYNTGTNEFEVTGAWNGVFAWPMVVATDADANETWILTLSAPVNCVINTAVANFLVRAAAGAVASFEFLDEVVMVPRVGIGLYENADGTWQQFAADAMRTGDQGLLLEKVTTNLFSNPRGEGGTAGSGTVRPTGWTVSAGWTLDSFGTHANGLPYTRWRRTFTSLVNSDFLPSAARIPSSLGFHTQGIGVKVVSTPTGGNILTIEGHCLGYSSLTGGSSVSDASYSTAVGSNLTWAQFETSTSAASVTHYLPYFRLLAPTVLGEYVIDLFCPYFYKERLGSLPVIPPAATLGQYTRAADEVLVAAAPPPEGTIFLDFDAVGRLARRALAFTNPNFGECILALSSDNDNYVELRHAQDGLLQLISVINGVTVADIQGGYMVPGKQHKVSFHYAQNDYLLVFDGLQIGSAITNQAVPLISSVTLGRDRNGLNPCGMRLRVGSGVRDDLRSLSNMLTDTRKAGLIGSPGINLAGWEFPNVQGDFIPEGDQDNKNGGALYWIDRLGSAVARFPFDWDQMQPNLGPFMTGGGTVATTYMDKIVAQVGEFGAHGLKLIPDMHNYGTHRISGVTRAIGHAELPISAYVTAWTTLVQAILDAYPTTYNDYVGGYDLMNECGSGVSDANQIAMYQQAIDAIRAIETTAGVLPVPFYIEGKGSASITHMLGKLTDPANLIIYSVHHYYDNNGSGTYINTYTGELVWPERGVVKAEAFARLMYANGYVGNMGEGGVPSNDSRYWTVESNAFKTFHAHGISVFPWAAGPAWGNYPLNIEPTGLGGAKVDRNGRVTTLRKLKYQVDLTN